MKLTYDLKTDIMSAKTREEFFNKYFTNKVALCNYIARYNQNQFEKFGLKGKFIDYDYALENIYFLEKNYNMGDLISILYRFSPHHNPLRFTLENLNSQNKMNFTSAREMEKLFVPDLIVYVSEINILFLQRSAESGFIPEEYL